VAGVYVASFTPSGSFPYRLERFDPQTLTLLDYIDDMASPAIAAGNLWAIGTGANAGNLYRLDRDDVSNVLNTINVGSVSRLSGTNERLYLTELSGSTANDRVERLNPTDGSSLWNVSGTVAGPNPTIVVDDGTYAYVINAEFSARSVTKLDASDGSFVDDVQLANEPFDMTLVGSDLYVIRGTPTAMDRIATSTMTVTQGVATGSYGGTDVFLSLGGIGFSSALRFSVGTQSIVETVSLSANQAGLSAALETDFYTTGFASSAGRLTRFTIGPLTESNGANLFGSAQQVAVLYRNPGAGWVVGSVGW
jgi:hypothetical protein